MVFKFFFYFVLLLFYSTPAAGFFNDDDLPDFLIHSNIGPGYPIYYNAEVTNS